MATSLGGKTYFVFHLFILLVPFGWGRDHLIQLKEEVRQTIELSKFGFLQNGILKVNFSNMVVNMVDNPGQRNDVLFGFSLEKTGSDGISPYMEQHSEKCILKDQSQLITNANQISLALIKFDLLNGHIIINTIGSDFLNLTIDKKPALPVHAEIPITKPATSGTVSPSTGQNTSGTAPDSTGLKSSTPSTSARPNTLSMASGSDGKKSSTASGSPSSAGPNTSTASSSAGPNTSTAATLTNTGENTSATSSSSTAGQSSSTSASPSAKQTSSAVTPTSQAASVPKNSSTVANVEDNEPPTVQSTSDGNVTAKAAHKRKRRDADTTPVPLVKSEVKTLPLKKEKTVNISEFKYSGNFVVKIKTKAEEGLYNLYFHNCPLPKNKDRASPVPVAIQIRIVEKNGANFLSAGEEPLPYMFGILSVLFFGTAIYWLRVLRKNREYTYKVHYMMFVLVLLKAMDLMFQAVNYHFISKDGKPAESWEVLYYITHLLKGALLFTTIVLIGTGYFFIKHVLSDRDKKIFMIIIPLQILANTAQIVMESTEEASVQYATWKELFILVDLLCCGAILFPVVWSIRHLQEGSQTDGKAALNLAKLKLFRHFYVMIVCYIYFTRIIVYLIKITVPFQYMWLDDFFNNAASYVFFVLTGYKFRPAPDNPYLHVPQGDSDDEMEMEEVVTNAGVADGVTRLHSSSSGKRIFETA